MAEFRSKWGINETDWVVGYTGRLVRDKGIIELVDAFQLIKANNPKLKLLWWECSKNETPYHKRFKTG